MASIGAIVTCVLICGLAAHHWIAKQRSQAAALAALPDVYPTGTVVTVPPDWGDSQAHFTILVGVSTACRACSDSMPALRRLNEHASSRAGDQAIRIVGIGTEAADILSTYFAEHGLTAFVPSTITRDSHLAPVVMRTPTLVLLDASGAVLDSWPGLMTITRLQQVLRRLETQS